MSSYGSHSQGLRWISCSQGQIPSGAVPVGREKDGGTLYAGRADHDGHLLPAKVSPNHHGAYVGWGGGEHCKKEYDVLVGNNFAWKYFHGGEIPPQAVIVGHTNSGEDLYMGRVYHEGTITPGKVHPTHRCLYITHNRVEIPFNNYEIMATGGTCDSFLATPCHQASSRFSWNTCYQGQIPSGAVCVGQDKDGGALYAGRADHEGDLLPAKVSPNHHGAYVTWEGGEHCKDKYDVLVSNDIAWKYSHDGEIPPQAMIVGHTNSGENLYLGRAYHDGTITPGKVHPSHRCLYIPYDRTEISFHKYEIMVLL